MAFTGTPVIQEVSTRLYRVTGVSLPAGAVGTISLESGTGEVKLPRSDDWAAYRDVTLQDAVSVLMNLAGHAPPVVAVPISVIKTGTVPADFLVTLTNETSEEDGDNSGPLEIYVGLH
jgi:hypothetical protein